MSTGRRFYLFFSISLAVIILDSFTKFVTVNQSRRFTFDAYANDFVPVSNRGALFGLGDSILPPVFFFVVGAGVLIICCVMVTKSSRTLASVAAGFFMGGTFGNLIDRAFRAPNFGEGAVVDFIRMGDWFVFNLADACIAVGLLFLAWLIVTSSKSKIESPKSRILVENNIV